MIAKTTKINFEKCPLYLSQFDILDLESKKKSPTKGAPRGAPFAFGERLRDREEKDVGTNEEKK